MRLTAEALDTLATMPFEGNIRELRNLLERATLLADSDEIEPDHLVDVDDELGDGGNGTPESAPCRRWLTLDQNEYDYLAWALRNHQGDRPTLARRLGLSERTLFRKLRDLAENQAG
jgi:two-component system, NtrC family, response regulator HydG